MARPALTYAALWSLTLALLIGATIFTGLRQSPSTWAALLRLSDCELPCWIDIQPGKTALADARQQIQAVYGNMLLYHLQENNNYFTVIYTSTGQRMSVVLDSESRPGIPSPVVSKIHLWPDVTLNSPATVAELYSSLGDAEGVRLTSMGGVPVLVLFQRAQQVGVAVDAPECNRVLPGQGIYAIVLSDQPLGDYFSWLSALAPWRGFQRCYDLAFTPHS